MATKDSVLIKAQRTVLKFEKRAERADDQILAHTFVDSAPLFDLIATNNNQVIYGRRGTGKTHALKFLVENIYKNKDTAVYIDLRSIGSNGSIYSDTSKTLAQRAGTLIRDVLNGIYDELYGIAIDCLDDAPDPRQITARLDDFQTAISQISITGDVENEDLQSVNQARSSKASAGLSITPTSAQAEMGASHERTTNEVDQRIVRRTGTEVVHLNFGRVGIAIEGLIRVLGAGRVWLLIDEWSEVPVELQPYLADLLRRTILPIRDIVVKIAAIEHRSQFTIKMGKGAYVGIELGADMSADLDLDNFLVFDNDESKSLEFFKTLMFRHFRSFEEAPSEITTPEKLISLLFTQAQTFEEFLRAVEGVPRDALNLATKLVTRAWGEKISVNHVRIAAREWYNQDKASVVRDNQSLNDLLSQIIDEVIGKRRSRAFLFPSGSRDERIDSLFDARILHIPKKNVSTHDQPGQRYDVYKIDYGCYVELINTTKAPLGLFEASGVVTDELQYVEVPKDDYRSIRRAILRLSDLPPIAVTD